MKIKKFYGFTLKDATKRMKEELGSESVILSTRVVKNEEKFGDRTVFEVTAGMEEEELEEKEKKLPNEIKEPTSTSIKSKVDKKENVQQELEQLTAKIYKQKQILSYEKKEEPRYPKISDNYPKIKEIENLLTLRDVDPEIIETIISEMKKNKGFLGTDYENQLFTTISSLIPVAEFTVQKGKEKKIISFVGPTGVGKTTCIAKLALISKIIHKLDIGLITMDTYRLGALDQLKIFSEISNIELEIAYEPKDIVSAVRKFKTKDLIFIDTVGRSQNNLELLKDIKQFVSSVKVDETFLVLNSTSSLKNMLDIAEKFEIFNYNGLIFTKLDESVSFGNLLNLSSKIEIPIKFLTNGQTIPDDIIAADSDFVANLVISGKLNR